LTHTQHKHTARPTFIQTNRKMFAGCLEHTGRKTTQARGTVSQTSRQAGRHAGIQTGR